MPTAGYREYKVKLEQQNPVLYAAEYCWSRTVECTAESGNLHAGRSLMGNFSELHLNREQGIVG